MVKFDGAIGWGLLESRQIVLVKVEALHGPYEGPTPSNHEIGDRRPPRLNKFTHIFELADSHSKGSCKSVFGAP